MSPETLKKVCVVYLLKTLIRTRPQAGPNLRNFDAF